MYMSEVKRNLVDIKIALTSLNHFSDFTYGVTVDGSDIVIYKQWCRSRGRNRRFDRLELFRESKLDTVKCMVDGLVIDREYN